MRARMLVQDESTKKHDIVWFGSYGTEQGKTETTRVAVTKALNSTLLCSNSTICGDSTIVSGQSYYVTISPNLFLANDSSLEIKVDYTGGYDYLNLSFSCKIFNGKEWKIIEVSKINQHYSASINIGAEIWPLVKSAMFISNCEICISYDLDDILGAEFDISYPVKASKLTYDRARYVDAKSTPTYAESQAFSYSSGAKSVRDALIPRLSIIQGELWYKPSYGLPLMSKLKSKGIYDSVIVGYIVDYPDVLGIGEFESSVDGHDYRYDCTIDTVYGEQTKLASE